MSSRHHIDDFMRGRIIGKIEEGRKITNVAREFDIAHSVASRLWKSFKTTGMCSRRHGGGRVRYTTPTEDRYIVLSAKRNRRTTAQQVANQFLVASRKKISRKLLPDVWEEGRTIRTQTGCVCPIDLDRTVLPVCNGVVSITIGLLQDGGMRTILRRGEFSVYHRIVDANYLAREWYCLSSRKYFRKRTDIRHAVS
ncbi:transposable element Tcb1 transposase [Trichonephila clavipes]|nr:transposable element Tcb1 transposase [Trichonephila clavipes]